MEIDYKSYLKGLDKIFKLTFSSNGNYELKYFEDLSSENMLGTANRLVHFGWKKEAVPVSVVKKSLISRFFEILFK